RPVPGAHARGATGRTGQGDPPQHVHAVPRPDARPAPGTKRGGMARGSGRDVERRRAAVRAGFARAAPVSRENVQAGAVMQISNARIDALAETIWRYHHLDHELSPADAILVLCSHDTIVARRGAELFLQKCAPLLLLSGGPGSITHRLARDPGAAV